MGRCRGSARGGKKPSTVYARTTSASIQMSDTPKIAIVLGGMGLNQELTAKAIKALPGDVSFAFAPYGENLQSQVNKARAAGHEIMLQLPMEPFRYPATNPGPKTLVIAAGEEANMDALMWHMSRFAGYIGASAYMGGNFLADPAALRPVLAEMKKRGLYFMEDVPSQKSSAADVGASSACRFSRPRSSSMPTPTPRRSPRRWHSSKRKRAKAALRSAPAPGLRSRSRKSRNGRNRSMIAGSCSFP